MSVSARTPVRWWGLQAAFAVLIAALSTAAYSSTPKTDLTEEAARSITAEELRGHLRFLASDELQGRGTGHRGNEVAELYAAAMFERLDLERPTRVAFLQPVELYFSKLGPATELTVSERVNAADVTIRHAPGSDFLPHSASASRSVNAALAFAGYGITAPEHQYDDYAELDARGRIVVVLEGEPQADSAGGRFDGAAHTTHSRVESKIANAKKHGAVGLLVVRARMRDVKSAWPDDPSVRRRDYQLAERADRATLTVAYISSGAADAILAGTDQADRRTISALKKQVDDAIARAGKAPVSAPAAFVIERQGRLTVDLVRESVVVNNVLAMVEGADPSLKKEIIVVGAHLDHDGIDVDGRVYNGADDNASGTVAVLETAEAFAVAAKSGRRPARTVVFALWNAEEKGSLGSEYYVEHPAPEGTLAANVNLDMVGRNEDVPDPNDFRFAGLAKTTAAENTNTVHLLGYSYSPELAALVREENRPVGLRLKEELDKSPQNLIRRSDQWSFLQAGIPAVFLTTGLHPDYHTPQDDVGRINFEKLEKIARLAFRVTWRLASDADLPAFVDPHGRRNTH